MPETMKYKFKMTKEHSLFMQLVYSFLMKRCKETRRRLIRSLWILCDCE